MSPTTATRVRRAAVTEDFAALFNAQFAHMVRLAALLGADDPEDVAQEAFARLDRRLDRLPPNTNTLAYVRTTVVNLTRSRLRHLRVARRFVPEHPLVESAEVLAVLSDDRRRVIESLSGLSTRQRQVLVLRYWLDLSEREIADTLGIRPGTVKSTTSAALAALSKALGDDDERN
jgi:RNA polymerase sigma-70 factor (sigma-E family)